MIVFSRVRFNENLLQIDYSAQVVEIWECLTCYSPKLD